MLRIYICVLTLSGFVQTAFGQGISINNDGATPDASAILDLQSTSWGFLTPRMTAAQREAISSPAEGLMVYDTNFSSYFKYCDGQWRAVNNTSQGTTSVDVPANPNIGDRYYDHVADVLYFYTSGGWASVVAGTPTTSPYGDGSVITFGEVTGNSIAIESWLEDDSYDGYVILINENDEFENLIDGDKVYASTTYASNGAQVIFDGTSTSQLEVRLLLDQVTYYFKVVPYTGNRIYDNTQGSQIATTSECTYDSETESQLCLRIADDLMTISSNQIPNHVTGDFPNYEGDNGEEYTATIQSSEIDHTPTQSGSIVYVYDETGGPTPSNQNFYRFGFATNGLGFNPMGLKPWSILDESGEETGEENWEWQAAVVDEGNTHLDSYGGHVTSQGKYHYHGDPNQLAPDEDGSRHSLIYGWAADGFPIYYKYGYSDPADPSSDIIELTSSYQIKSGARNADEGIAGQDYPDGDYDGTYIQDYEYVDGLGALDECNGRTAVTPEYPDGTYYYVLTADFPKVPNCFVGTPGEDFIIGN